MLNIKKLREHNPSWMFQSGGEKAVYHLVTKGSVGVNCLGSSAEAAAVLRGQLPGDSANEGRRLPKEGPVFLTAGPSACVITPGRR